MKTKLGITILLLVFVHSVVDAQSKKQYKVLISNGCVKNVTKIQ